MIYPQIYVKVQRPHIEAMVNKYVDQGYLLIQSADLERNKVLLTFEKVSDMKSPEFPKPFKATKKASSEEIPDSLLEEVWKK